MENYSVLMGPHSFCYVCCVHRHLDLSCSSLKERNLNIYEDDGKCLELENKDNVKLFLNVGRLHIIRSFGYFLYLLLRANIAEQ